jgi:NADH:ubiquinone oxidoreductase subunit H
MMVALRDARLAYLYADRKVWAAVQLRAGPTWSGRSACCRASPTLLKFVFKETGHPVRRQQGRLSARAADP